MGLEEREKSLFVKVPESSKPHPAGTGLPRFVDRFTRAELLKGFGSIVGGYLIDRISGIFTKRNKPAYAEVNSPTDKAQLLNDKITELNVRALDAGLGDDFDITGQQLTRPFENPDGSTSVVYDKEVFTLSPDGNLTVGNTISDAEQTGYNIRNVQFFDDPIPQRGFINILPTDDINQMIQTLGKILGFNAFVTGSEDFNGRIVYRIGDETGDKIGLIKYTKGDQTGLTRLTSTGSLAINSGLVPKEMMLAEGELATGGGGSTETQPRPVFTEYKLPNPPTQQIGDLNTDGFTAISAGKLKLNVTEPTFVSKTFNTYGVPYNVAVEGIIFDNIADIPKEFNPGIRTSQTRADSFSFYQGALKIDNTWVTVFAPATPLEKTLTIADSKQMSGQDYFSYLITEQMWGMLTIHAKESGATIEPVWQNPAPGENPSPGYMFALAITRFVQEPLFYVTQ